MHMTLIFFLPFMLSPYSPLTLRVNCAWQECSKDNAANRSIPRDFMC